MTSLGFLTRVTRRVPLVEDELLILPAHLSLPLIYTGFPEHLSLPLIYTGFPVAKSLAFCVVLCRLFFFYLSFSVFYCTMSFFQLWLLMIRFVSSGFPSLQYYQLQSIPFVNVVIKIKIPVHDANQEVNSTCTAIEIVCQSMAIFIIASSSNGQATNIQICAHLKDVIP